MSNSMKTIPVALPLLDEREAEAAKRPIMSGWVTQGPCFIVRLLSFIFSFSVYFHLPSPKNILPSSIYNLSI